METINFEWDENKNTINKKKHGLSFEEAKEVFTTITLFYSTILTILSEKKDF